MDIKNNYYKFRRHFKENGFMYAVWRGLKYLIYFINNLKETKIRRIKHLEELKYIERENCRIFLDIIQRQVKIYWKEKEITKDVGLNTSLFIGRRFYNAREAKWKMFKENSYRATISSQWRSLPVRQIWDIEIDEAGVVRLDMRMDTYRKIKFTESKISLMISPEYKRWFNGYEEGFFPPIIRWEEISLKELKSTCVGVKGILEKNKPSIIFDFSNCSSAVIPQIQNTSRDNNAHVLNIRFAEEKEYFPGRYNFFSGRIIITEEDKRLENYIAASRERLVRDLFYKPQGKSFFKVALVNLPWERDGRWGARAGSRWPHIKDENEGDYLPFPFFLAYAASLLKKEGIRFFLIDCLAEKITESRFLDTIEMLKPHLLVCETSTPSLQNDIDILKKVNSNISICLYGPEVNIRNPEFLKRYEFIDYVIVGEFEYTLRDLARCLMHNEKLDNILGLIYRENGEIKVNPLRPLIKNLDELPWPLRDELPIEKYIDAPGGMPLPSVQMWASRGCPFQCTFCLWPQLMYQSNIYRAREPLKVAEEMEYLVKEKGFKSIYFDDDTFNIGKERIFKICAEIKKRKLCIPWAIMARPDLMDEELLKGLKSAGLYAIKYGLESGVQELLDNAGKDMDLEKSIKMIKLTKDLDIKVHLTFTFGLPGETWETIHKTIDLALELAPFSLQFSITTPFPGTTYFEKLEKGGEVFFKNWADFDGNHHSVIKTAFLKEGELEKAKRMAYDLWQRNYEKCNRRTKKKILSTS